jgi:hypothetical protein
MKRVVSFNAKSGLSGHPVDAGSLSSTGEVLNQQAINLNLLFLRKQE